MQVFLGSVMPWTAPYAPSGWAFCNGALLSINTNTALYSLLGTAYGGDGINTFALPDLRQRIPMGADPQQGLGAKGGSTRATIGNTVSLSAAQLPGHKHPATLALNPTTTVAVGTSTTDGEVSPSEGATLTSTAEGVFRAAAIYLPATIAPTQTVTLGGVAATVNTDATGTATVAKNATQHTPVSFSTTAGTLPPYLPLNYIIATKGIYPSRN